MNQQDDFLELDNTFNNHDETNHQVHHHHVPMELWQTQMSFRSDSSSAASSVDSSFLASPTSFSSPLFRKSNYNNNINNTPTFGAIPEAHLESPTLGVDIEVIHTSNNNNTAEEEAATPRSHVDAMLNPTIPCGIIEVPVQVTVLNYAWVT